MILSWCLCNSCSYIFTYRFNAHAALVNACAKILTFVLTLFPKVIFFLELCKNNEKKKKGSVCVCSIFTFTNCSIFNSIIWFKDTHREKAPSNKTPALRKSTNMGVWAVGTLNQLFIRGSLTETKLSLKSSYWQKSVLCNWPIL